MRILLLLLITYLASANTEIYPKKECELFNNLKHTKNRGHQVLELDRTYEMYTHHKGQYLVKVKGATPPQRWVDDDCMSTKHLRSTTAKSTVKNTVTSKQNILALSWHNAFCETHRYKLECKYRSKQYNTKHFVLHGLWPQPKSRAYCVRWMDMPDLVLDTDVETELAKIMPGYVSGLHKHEWVKHGTCSGVDPNTYFKDAISLTKQVNNSELGKLFEQRIGKYLSLREIRALTDKTFGKGTGKRIAIQCKYGLITELRLQLGSGSDDLAVLLKRGEPIHSRCKGGRVDEAGYGRY